MGLASFSVIPYILSESSRKRSREALFGFFSCSKLHTRFLPYNNRIKLIIHASSKGFLSFIAQAKVNAFSVLINFGVE